MAQTYRSTSEIEMIARRVVEQQFRVCQERMGRQGDRTGVLDDTIAEVKTGLADLEKAVDSNTEAQREKWTSVFVILERLDTRWSFFRVLSAIISALGAIAGISALIASLATHNP